MRFLLPLLLLPGFALAQPVKESKDGWETRQECWRDGTIEDCRGQLIERKAFYQSGVPVYLEFREKSTLVGLALNLNSSFMQCDKLEKRFVCEFQALPLEVPEEINKKKSKHVYNDSASMVAAGVDEKSLSELKLPWESVRVIALKSNGNAHLSVPLKNRPKHLKRARLESKKEEKGTTYHFYVVPRVFGLGQ